MENELIKKTIRLGNSSAVILPNSWKYKKVRIQLVENSIVQDVFEILVKRELLKDIIGIYLVGSYAREEESESSDVDILIITNSINKQIKEGVYEITFVSKKRFEERIKKSLYLASLVKESKALLNESYIKKYKDMDLNIPLKKYLKEIKSVIKFNLENLALDKEMGNKISGGVVYSLILRLRELYLVDCITRNKDYSKQKFLNLIDNDLLYDSYLRVKNNKKVKDNNSIDEVSKLIDKMKKFIKQLEK